MLNTQTEIETTLSFLNSTQIDALKHIVKNGFWGDTDQPFSDGKTYSANGYFTNVKGKGKEWSVLIIGISKSIKAANPILIKHASDFWDDGDGDLMFFNMEIFNEEALNEWANSN